MHSKCIAYWNINSLIVYYPFLYRTVCDRQLQLSFVSTGGHKFIFAENVLSYGLYIALPPMCPPVASCVLLYRKPICKYYASVYAFLFVGL